MSATATPSLRTEPQDQRVMDAAERLARRLMDGGLVAEGADAWVTVLAMRPLDLDVAVSAAGALREAGRFEDSMAVIDRVLRRRPGHVPAAAARASTLFAMERWREAFEAFEIRFKMMADPPAVTQTLADGRVVPRPAWSGGPVPKHVLVLAEQGMGDTIQFARFLPRLVAAGAEITFVVEERLHALIRTMELPVTLRDRGTPGSVEGVKGWVPLMSLPRALGLDAAEDLGIAAAQFRPDPARIARWRERIGDHGQRIGLIWQGNPDPSIDRGRSIPLDAFAPLAAIDGVRLVSLQKGFGTEQIAACAFADRIETPGEDFDAGADGFMDSLALLESLDGVVSSCTSLAHLAASQMKPTTILLKAQGADWRWLQARTDTVWYPTVTLARQPKPGDWAAVIATIADRLKAAAGVVTVTTAPEAPAGSHTRRSAGPDLDRRTPRQAVDPGDQGRADRG